MEAWKQRQNVGGLELLLRVARSRKIIMDIWAHSSSHTKKVPRWSRAQDVARTVISAQDQGGVMSDHP